MSLGKSEGVPDLEGVDCLDFSRCEEFRILVGSYRSPSFVVEMGHVGSKGMEASY
jgi:hypothetical protein